MRARMHRLLVGLAFASLTSLGCGDTKSVANRDGSSSDGAVCKGDPVSCEEGGPSGAGGYGPIFSDASVRADADASHDGPIDRQECGDESLTYCWQLIQASDVVICGDYGRPANCVDGQWTCLAGEIDGRMCTCTEFHPPGCGTCTPHGWACSDAGVDGDAAPDAVSADGG